MTKDEIEKELQSAKIKAERAESAGLDYEREFWSGYAEALELVRSKM